MLKLNDYTAQQRAELAQVLAECAEALGGLGKLLGLVEHIKSLSPMPLQNKTASFHYPHGKVSWEKVLFADKVESLSGIIRSRDSFDNLLAVGSKKERNTVRALFPVIMTITPREGEPYSFRAIEAPDDNTARIHPLLELLFFASTGLIKKAAKEA